MVRGGVEPPTFRFSGGRSYRLSYLTAPGTGFPGRAVLTGFEPATSTLTGWRALLAALQDHVLPADPASSAPNGIRTRAAALKGRCPRPLDDGGLRRSPPPRTRGARRRGPPQHRGRRPPPAKRWPGPAPGPGSTLEPRHRHDAIIAPAQRPGRTRRDGAPASGQLAQCLRRGDPCRSPCAYAEYPPRLAIERLRLVTTACYQNGCL